MFLKNKNIIFKIRRSKVTHYAALIGLFPSNLQIRVLFYEKRYKYIVYLLNVASINPFVPINGTSPFPILGLLGGMFHVY